MGSERTSVGLDVHARSVSGAAIDMVTGEVLQRRLDPSNQAVLAWVGSLPGPVRVTYEAGPTGFGLARAFQAVGVECVVAAPSRIIRPRGDRVKTDARDAVLLARLLKLDEIVAVRVPTRDEEDARDLVRAREDARGDLMAARHRLSKLLLRHGLVFPGKTAWSKEHERWLRSLSWDGAGTRAAVQASWEAVTMTVTRRNSLDAQIAAMAGDSQFTPVMRRLACLRGVSTLTAFGLAVEIGDWTRFTGASIGAYLGMTPSEHSSGASRSQGSITKAGNSHARRLLVEAAWQHRSPYRATSPTMIARWEQAPAAARARGDAGNRRLQKRWNGYLKREKPPTIAATAVARELAGWCWSLAVMTD